MTVGSDLDAILTAAADRLNSLDAAVATLDSRMSIRVAEIIALTTRVTAIEAGENTQNATLAALTAAVAALQVGTPPPPPPPVDHPPVWLTVPPVTFAQGKAAAFSFAGLASDPDGDPLTFTFSGSLPAGVTFDGPGKRLVYDGVGAVAATSGNFILADDGRA